MEWNIRARPQGAARRAPPPSGSPKARIRRTAADENALSSTHGVLLMVAVTIILAALVLLMVLAMIPSWSWTEPPQSPIIVTGIAHTSEDTGKLTYASRVTLKNNGSTAYENDCLKAVFYKNGQIVCIVQTLNGNLLISSHHYGVRFLEGEGCRTRYWNPGEEMIADLSDGTLYPGIEVTVEIVDKRDEKAVSKQTVKV
ncbi:type IV pilin [Methanoculleus sp. YWC-01]|jgi:flagellin-like protein|uniref:Type IV pilin n=1 Tax=Methanoculleus nereidis TaxID=2735141 RepID=A0ABU3Z331_9EURY|nr:type IV pilin [Methanoculleus sp. YWC-01]PKL56573.1 MAG: type IV pilin [Methanomicrobiales archaeon HGW-Methanomicrobiales-6]